MHQRRILSPVELERRLSHHFDKDDYPNTKKTLIDWIDPTRSAPLDAGLAAVRAQVLAALAGFDAANQLTQGGTVAGTEPTGDADLLGALGHGFWKGSLTPSLFC